MVGSQQVVLETSVLINFLRIDRVDLLARHPGYRFLITDHVRSEITDHYPEQLTRLETAIQRGDLQEISVTDPAELAAFGRLSATGLGLGECSAIAVAVVRALRLAIDDRVAAKRARRYHPAIDLINTEALMVSLIHHGLLDVPAADDIKRQWEQQHRFRLRFKSFAEVI